MRGHFKSRFSQMYIFFFSFFFPGFLLDLRTLNLSLFRTLPGTPWYLRMSLVHAEIVSVVHTEKLTVDMYDMQCMCVVLHVCGRWMSTSSVGHSGQSELPRSVGLAVLVQCSTAYTGMCNLAKVGDGDGNIWFPIEEVDLGGWEHNRLFLLQFSFNFGGS